MLKRILAGGLAVVMACSLFTGCGSSGASSSAGALPAIPEEAQKDVVSYLTDGAITSEETVMTVNGVEIPASAYFYQWAYFAGYLAYYYQGKDATDTFSLDKEINGTTYKDYLLDNTRSSLLASAIAAQKGQEQKLKLSADAKKTIDNLAESADENTRLYYATTLKGMEFLETCSDYNDQLKAALFRKGGEYEITKETLADYRKDNVMAAKHILLLTTGKSDEEKAKIKKTIQGYLDKILADKDPASAFEQYMNEKSEDTGLATNPDGYTFLPGEMVPEFEDAVSSLKVGEIDQKIVESSYGYHLIMRIEPDMDAIDDEDLKEKYESETYQKVLDDWSKDAKVETTKALDDLDMTKVYDKLTQLQSVIQAIAQAEAAAAQAASSGSTVSE